MNLKQTQNLKRIISQFNAYFLVVFVTYILLLLTSCKEEIVKTIELERKEFRVDENTLSGTLVGTIELPDSKTDKKYNFEILSGNEEDIFEINNQGELLVNNSELLDYEKVSTMNLFVKASLEENITINYLFNIIVSISNLTPTTENLFAYYKLDGDAIDHFATYNAASQNVLFMESENNLSNQTAYFNGVNSYVNFPDAFDFSNRTISLWFNTTEVESDLKIIFTSDHPNLKFGLIVFSVNQQLGEPMLNLNFSNQIHSVAINRGKWYHAVIRTNGLNYSYFLNGQLIKSDFVPNYIVSFNGNPTAILGCLRNLSDRFYSGKIDNLRIYNRDLSNQEIINIYKEEIWSN